MLIEIDGVTCMVPARWAKYTTDQKAVITRLVESLHRAFGDHLCRVSITRLRRERQQWTVVYGYSTTTTATRATTP